MKTTRRNFFKLCIAVTAAVTLSFIPNPSHGKDFSGTQPSPGRRPLFSREIICRNYIQDYMPGETVDKQDLIAEQDCGKCTYKDVCADSGTRFLKRKKNKLRTFFPELYGKDFQNDFIM